MKSRNLILGATLLAAALSGCATAPALTPEQVRAQTPAIEQLERELQGARQENVAILAPQGFAAAETSLAAAQSAAGRGQTAPAAQAAEAGIARLGKARQDARASASTLAEVLTVRERALDAGARELFRADLARLDEDFRDAAELVENGRLERAKQARPALRQAYADLELKALKEGTIQRAKQAIAKARSNDAHKLAPKTFGNAEESLKVAMSVLEADRTAKARADASAAKAVTQAQRSEQIAELVRDYDRRDFTPEDIVLWYQDQVSTLVSPLNAEVTFTASNDQTLAELRQGIAELVDQRQRLGQDSAAIAKLKAEHAAEIAALKKRFAGEQAQLTVAQQEREERFAFIRQLFKSDEATVYRQGDNVLISVHGFRFPPGSSEIQPQNFGTMNKIIQSIGAFRSAKVRVAGHTDATGSDNINLNLSAQRARNVARFLTDVGRIPRDIIIAQGYGSQRPVATNSTPEGRAQNRRIEVLIVNE